MTSKVIINRIGFFRNKAKLSVRELSLRIGKHDSYINKLENQGFNLSIDMLLKIIEALNVSVEEFFSDNFATYSTDKDITNIIKNLTPDKKQNLLNFIKQ